MLYLSIFTKCHYLEFINQLKCPNIIILFCDRRRSRGRGGRVGTRGRGRGRGTSIKRGSIRSRLLSSSCTATTEDTDVEGTSTDSNIPLKQSLSPSISRKKNITEYNEERELSLPRLKSTIIPENSTLLSSNIYLYIFKAYLLTYIKFSLFQC